MKENTYTDYVETELNLSYMTVYCTTGWYHVLDAVVLKKLTVPAPMDKWLRQNMGGSFHSLS
jgi:hypothetical protein